MVLVVSSGVDVGARNDFYDGWTPRELCLMSRVLVCDLRGRKKKNYDGVSRELVGNSGVIPMWPCGLGWCGGAVVRWCGGADSRGSGGCETATGVMGAKTRRKGVRGIRWDNVVITLIRGWIWRDLTLFPSGSSIRMDVSSNTSDM